MNESKKPYASVGGTELSLWDITKILLAKIHWLLLAGVVVAAGVYAVVTIFVTPTYESRVSFYVYNSADNSSQGTINNSDLQAAGEPCYDLFKDPGEQFCFGFRPE